MPEQTIDPGRVSTPTRLMAACLALLVVVEPAMITGAVAIERPSWASGLLVVAAVAYFPLILGFFLLLQTRFRVQLLADDKFLDYEKSIRDKAPLLEEMIAGLGVTLQDAIAGRVRPDAATTKVGEAADGLARSVEEFEAPAKRVSSELVREIAIGFFISSRWGDAATYFDEYVAQADATWEEQFSRGVAHANRRAGMGSDLSALDAYTRVEALIPDDAPKEMIARLYSYRGAINKRLGRLDDALRDLKIANRTAVTPYEILDTTYNLACVYAMRGDRQEALAQLRKLKELGGISLISPHMHDYFSSLNADPELLALLER